MEEQSQHSGSFVVFHRAASPFLCRGVPGDAGGKGLGVSMHWWSRGWKGLDRHTTEVGGRARNRWTPRAPWDDASQLSETFLNSWGQVTAPAGDQGIFAKENKFTSALFLNYKGRDHGFFFFLCFRTTPCFLCLINWHRFLIWGGLSHDFFPTLV